MRDNPYTGETPLQVGEETLTLQYTWRAQARLNQLVNDGRIDSILTGDDPDGLAELVVIGLDKHHPDITTDDILDASPPLQPTIEAVMKALNRSRFGVDESPLAKAAEQAAAFQVAQTTKTRSRKHSR